MVEPMNETAPAGESAGLFSHLSALAAAKLAYLRARLELAGLEGREAAVHYGIILGMVTAAALVLALGYLFFIIALVFLVALLCDGGNAWIWVLLGAAFLHIGGAAALLLIAKKKLATPTFTATLDELRKDQEWLKANAKLN